MGLKHPSYRWLVLALALAAILYAQRGWIAFELGYAYASGDFHAFRQAPDATRAAAWLRHAARAGHPRAQYLLGMSYSRGRGVRQDDTEAERWFALAAAQAYGQACFHLAWMARKGEGVAHDETRAQRLMACAAEQGVAGAAQALRRFRAEPAR